MDRGSFFYSNLLNEFYGELNPLMVLIDMEVYVNVPLHNYELIIIFLSVYKSLIWKNPLPLILTLSIL